MCKSCVQLPGARGKLDQNLHSLYTSIMQGVSPMWIFTPTFAQPCRTFTRTVSTAFWWLFNLLSVLFPPQSTGPIKTTTKYI